MPPAVWRTLHHFFSSLSGVLLPLTFTIPLGSAFLKGVSAARDPSHRLTPQSPWFFFWRAFRRRVRLPAFLLVPLGLGGLSIFAYAEFRYAQALYPPVPRWPMGSPVVWHLFVFVDLPSRYLAIYFTTAAAYFSLAPRASRLWMLVSSGLPTGVALFAACFWVIQWLVPSPVMHFAYPQPSKWADTASFHGVYTAALCFLELLVAWRMAKSDGERWFRFES